MTEVADRDTNVPSSGRGRGFFYVSGCRILVLNFRLLIAMKLSRIPGNVGGTTTVVAYVHLPRSHVKA
jgi:hypothetical protein